MASSYCVLHRDGSERGSGGVGLWLHERYYLVGFVPLEAFVSFFHPLLLAPRLPFLPLLAISVYSAVGVHLAAALALQLWLKLRRDGCDNP